MKIAEPPDYETVDVTAPLAFDTLRSDSGVSEQENW